MLADASGIDGLWTNDVGQSLNYKLRSDCTISGLFPPEGELVAETVEKLQPVGNLRATKTELGVGLAKCGKDLAGIADDGNINFAELANLCRVNVGVDYLRVRREGIQITGNTVVETRANSDEQVGLLQSSDG